MPGNSHYGASIMKVLLVGVGGVGEGIAVNAKSRPWLEEMILADFDLERARRVQTKLGDPLKFPVEKVDAGSREQIVALARKYNVDLIMNAVTCDYNPTIFEAA